MCRLLLSLALHLTPFFQLNESLAAKRARVDELKASHESAKEAHSATQTALTNKEELLQNLLTGLSSSSSSGGGYMGQLADAKSRLSTAKTAEEQNRARLGHAQKELKALEKRWKEVEKEAGDGRKRLAEKEAEVEKLQKKVESSGWGKERETQNEMAVRSARADVRQYTEVSHLFHNYASGAEARPSKPMPPLSASRRSTLVINPRTRTSTDRK